MFPHSLGNIKITEPPGCCRWTNQQAKSLVYLGLVLGMMLQLHTNRLPV
ncbi:hypothetical protein [Picosynechococcus sp. NKBG15041c]|nr:hypothetical protein [Picosynechococcus sp. NKBG15041c]